jgi:hypothetical protein
MNNTYIVISAEKSNLSALENIQRSAELEDCLDAIGLTYKRAIGRYRGSEETSFIVTLNTYKQINIMLRLGVEFNQESILEIKQGHGWLINTDGSEEYIGSIYQATGREDSYTQVGSNLFTFKKGA